MFSVNEWKRRILTYFAYGAKQRIRCSTKEQVLRAIGGTSHENAIKAFDELVRENLVESADDDKFFTINFDRCGEILEIVSAEPEERLDLAQPVQEALQDYNLQFAVQSKWEYANQRTYYYYTRKDDATYWIVITKKSGAGGDDKIILGSFNDANSRISRIWRATQQAARREPDGKFVRKWVEDLEPEACGNNRMPSGAAFRLFRHLKMIELVETKGKTEYYRLTGNKPPEGNLDKFFNVPPDS